MTGFHRALALVAVLGALAGALVAAQSWRRASVGDRLLSVTVLMSAVVAVQAAVGVVLAAAGARPADGVTHFVVGPLALFVLPGALLVIGGRRDRSAAATLTIAWVVLLGLSLRAVGSGGLS